MDIVFQLRYPNIGACPKCKLYMGYYPLKKRKAYTCGNNQCGHLISPLASTIFHRSSTPLSFWFYSLYLVSISGNQIRAIELERVLGVTYKTAWRMRKLIYQLGV